MGGLILRKGLLGLGSQGFKFRVCATCMLWVGGRAPDKWFSVA